MALATLWTLLRRRAVPKDRPQPFLVTNFDTFDADLVPNLRLLLPSAEANGDDTIVRGMVVTV